MRIGLDLTSGFLSFQGWPFLKPKHWNTIVLSPLKAYDRTRHYDLLVTNNPIHRRNRPQFITKTTWIWKIWQEIVSYYSLKAWLFQVFCETHLLTFLKIKKLINKESLYFVY